MMRTYCNPLNLPYQYQHYGTGAHREAADPTLILYKGRYYMFASMTGGCDCCAGGIKEGMPVAIQ